MNAYAPPKANLLDSGDVDLTDSTAVNRGFYVVAKRKFIIMMIGTLGAYTLYWFYKNWREHKNATAADVWPVPRAIFAIFFVHSLFRTVDRVAGRREIKLAWDPSALATAYVVMLIANWFLEKLGTTLFGTWIGLMFQLASLGFQGFLLYRAQVEINKACGDPEGESNRALTWANWLWIAIYVTLMVGMVLILRNAPA
ncbi:hypothetical protein [Chitinimonas naiadis]